MDIDLTIKNYRCFPDTRPARLSLRKGFTAFVGVNNSGKSSLLKFFYEFRSVFQTLSSPTGNLLGSLNGSPQAFGVVRSVADIEELFCRMNDRSIEIQLEFPGFRDGTLENSPPSPSRIDILIPRATNTWLIRLVVPECAIDKDKYEFNGTLLCKRDGTPRTQLSPLFEACKDLSRTLYIGPFRNAINIGTNEDYFDIQVGQSFIRQWRAHLTGQTRRHNEAAYRLTEEIKNIFQYEDLRINPSADDQTLQIFVNGRSFGLSELGSGLTQFILVLANAAIKQPSYILIDEPELNLHPSLQLEFLTTLASYAYKGILFGSHNIGLARSSAQRVYLVRRIDEGDSEVVPYEATPRLSEFLGELSFSGYRTLGFDKVLLVEGSTDVLVIQQFLHIYDKYRKVVIVPLGGSSLINASSAPQLEEIKRISENVSALIDSELDSPQAQLSPERKAFKQNCDRAGINCHVLKRRALENYLSDRAIKVELGSNYVALSDYEKLEEAKHGWSKAQNWRIAKEMTREDLRGTDLDTFLHGI